MKVGREWRYNENNPERVERMENIAALLLIKAVTSRPDVEINAEEKKTIKRDVS